MSRSYNHIKPICNHSLSHAYHFAGLIQLYRVHHRSNISFSQKKKTTHPAANLAQARSPHSGERSALA